MKTLLVLVLFFILPLAGININGKSIIKSQSAVAQEKTQKPPEELEENDNKPETKPEVKKEDVKKEDVKKPDEQQKPKTPEGETLEDNGPYKASVPDRLRFYKEKYEEEYDKSFEIVWNSVKKSLVDIGCQVMNEKYSQTDQGLYKGFIKSDFCVFSAGDTTFSVLKKYSYELPLIRGGVWSNGRMQYTFIIKEISPGKINLVLKGELSGLEDYVTHEVQFWKSNGIFEHQILEIIKKNMESPSSGSAEPMGK